MSESATGDADGAMSPVSPSSSNGGGKGSSGLENSAWAAKAHAVLARVFSSCARDPKGSVHRAWGLSLIFVALYFVISVVEMINLESQGGSKALVIASIWSGIMHLMLGVLGTFVLKRFPTSFSVGFFLGVLVVLANQNLILFGTFHAYMWGSSGTNHAFANLMFSLFMIMTFFAVLLFFFKAQIVVAPIDAAKGGGGNSGLRGHHHHASPEKADSTDYQQYDEPLHKQAAI